MTTHAAPMVRTEQRGRVRTIVLDRPEKRNALSQAMWLALRDALVEASDDDGTSVVVLTGTGDSFTAGQDLGEMADPSVLAGEEPGFLALMPVVEELRKPLVASVNGVGVGIGMTILLHCDLVVVADEARVRAPFVSLGVTTEASASVLLPATIGWQQACRVLFTEPWLTGPELVELGMAVRSVPRAELAAVTDELAQQVAGLPLASLIATKELLLAGRLDAIRAARHRELAVFERLVGDATNAAALSAILERETGG